MELDLRGLFSSLRDGGIRLLVTWALVATGLFGVVLSSASPAFATAGIGSTINFQGRLLTASGAVVADGTYNMEFTLVQDGTGCVSSGSYPCSGTTTWTEDWLNDYSGGVTVRNGYFSVNLGTWCSFTGAACTGGQTQSNTGVNWNDNTLWLSMNVGSGASATSATCTDAGGASPCTFDGPMLPLRQLSSTVYAESANGLTGTNGLLTSSDFVQLAQGIQAASTSTNPAIGINASGTGNIITLQSSSADVFDVTSAGNVLFGSGAGHTISVAQPASGTGAALTIAAAQGAAGTGAGGGLLTLQGGAGGGTNGNGGGVSIDAGAATGTGSAGTITIGGTNAGSVTIGRTTTSASSTINSGTGGISLVTGVTSTSSTTSGTVSLATGNATGATSNSGSITLNVGTATGTPGSIDIGTANIANTVQVGSTILSAGTQVINIGNNNTAGGTTNVTIGSGSAAGGGSTTIQAKGALALQGGAASTINTTAANLTVSTTTSGTLALTSAGALNLSGAAPSTWDIGNNTLSLQTTNNGAITTGTGNVTLGGNTSISANKTFTADGAATFADATTSASAFLVQSGSSTVLGVDTSANQVLFGQSGFAGKLVVYGSTSGYATLIAAATTSTPYSLALPNAGDGTTGDCLKTASGTTSTATALTWGSCGGGGGGTQTVTLTPEFAGAVFSASSGSGANTGYMQSDHVSGLTSAQGYEHNFYEWSTDQASAQDYDIIAEYQIPTGFTSFVSGSWKAWVYEDSLTSTSVQYNLTDETASDTACYSAFQNISPTTAATWQQSSISDPSLCTFSAGDIIKIDIRLTAISPNTNWVKMGELTFQYQ